MDDPTEALCADELRNWPTTEAGARAAQERLRPLVALDEPGPEPGFAGTVAGVDVAYDDARDLVVAAAVALDAATLSVVAEATAVGSVAFPYVPGLLAFREIPTVIAALADLPVTPDLLVCDGYGYAHPRRFGLASHLGVLTGLPSIGVAKTPFLFRHGPLGPERGATAPLVDEGYRRHEADGGNGSKDALLVADGGGDAAWSAPETAATAGSGVAAGPGEVVGMALRTRAGVKPVFVSVGHRVDLAHACALTLALAPSYRLPETTRAADSLCRRALAAL
ncbi:endonuclease V [Streptomyces sp. NPDC059740]|uniref:endonuclease V n=1 Tax=Streptomyces sp. NPDC059740 TaxID=3346926 RepID=UPI0036678136